MSESNLEAVLNDEDLEDEDIESVHPDAENDEKSEIKEPEAVEVAQEPTQSHDATEWQYAAFKDEKSKRQSLERELEELRQKLTSFEAQKKEDPAPDIFEDPDGYRAHQENQLAIQRQMFDGELLSQRIEMSEQVSRIKHGDDLVDQAQQAFLNEVKTKPYLVEEMKGHRAPMEYVINWHKEKQRLSQPEIDMSEFEAFKAWKASQSATQQEEYNSEAGEFPTDMAGVASKKATAKSAGFQPVPLSDLL